MRDAVYFAEGGGAIHSTKEEKRLLCANGVFPGLMTPFVHVSS
jgi:hypothetical protein